MDIRKHQLAKQLNLMHNFEGTMVKFELTVQNNLPYNTFPGLTVSFRRGGEKWR